MRGEDNEGNWPKYVWKDERVVRGERRVELIMNDMIGHNIKVLGKKLKRLRLPIV